MNRSRFLTYILALFAASTARAAEPLTTQWVGHPMVSDNDRYTPSQGWLPKIQIGLRSDGVVVWRDFPPETKFEVNGKKFGEF